MRNIALVAVVFTGVAITVSPSVAAETSRFANATCAAIVDQVSGLDEWDVGRSGPDRTIARSSSLQTVASKAAELRGACHRYREAGALGSSADETHLGRVVAPETTQIAASSNDKLPENRPRLIVNVQCPLPNAPVGVHAYTVIPKLDAARDVWVYIKEYIDPILKAVERTIVDKCPKYDLEWQFGVYVEKYECWGCGPVLFARSSPGDHSKWDKSNYNLPRIIAEDDRQRERRAVATQEEQRKREIRSSFLGKARR